VRILVGAGARGGVPVTSMASAANTASNPAMNRCPGSRDRNRSVATVDPSMYACGAFPLTPTPMSSTGGSAARVFIAG
jgi:hypothetical protein